MGYMRFEWCRKKTLNLVEKDQIRIRRDIHFTSGIVANYEGEAKRKIH